MSNSIMDILSSPDPLNESLQGSAPPSSIRRVTRSQTSHKFFSLVSSPRKQTFELDVGNAISPQKLLVTVEAEDDARGQPVNRRLFTSPAPPRSATRSSSRRGAPTTTTTMVPVKGLNDDGGPTPKRRGRPPRSATPTAKGSAGNTPSGQRTPRQRRKKNDAQSKVPASETATEDDEATPRPSATRRSAKRAAPTASSGDQAVESSQPRKRGRPRRVSLVPEELLEMVGQEPESTSELSHAISQDDVEPVTRDDAPMTDDIWMETLSDDLNTVGRRWSKRDPVNTSTSDTANTSHADPKLPDEVVPLEREFDDGAMDLHSIADTVSRMDEDDVPRIADQETIMEGEEFTMISMNVMPSLQANANQSADDLPEIGEATSLIISRTLESLRQEHSRADLQVGEEAPTAPADEAESSQVPEMEPAVVPLETTGFTSMFSSAAPNRPIKSPRRAKEQDLGRQVALKSLQKPIEAVHPEPSPTIIPAAGASSAVEATEDYEDSFSEIPEAFLEAMTPKRVAALKPVLDGPGVVENAAPTAVHARSASQSSRPEETSRLPTPDETPSPNEAGAPKHQVASDEADSVIKSSPPIPPRRIASETPADQVTKNATSPSNGEGERALSRPGSAGSRPTLSPIVRAGLSLQLAMSDPQSSSPRSSVLGSPFRPSSAERAAAVSAETPRNEKHLQASTDRPITDTAPAPHVSEPVEVATQQAQKSWAQTFSPFSSIRSLVAQGAQVFSPLSRTPSGRLGKEPEPFIADVQAARGHTSRPSPGMNNDQEQDTHTGSPAGCTHVDPPSGDEMSWEADERAPNIQDFEEHAASPDSDVVASRGSSVRDDEDLFLEDQVSTRNGHQGLEPATDVEEEDIWAVEAKRPTPARASKATLPQPVAPADGNRGFPSLWKRSTRRDDPPPRPSDVSEYSLLSHTGYMDQESVEAGPARPALTNSKMGMLYSFFSSPAAVPDATLPSADITASAGKSSLRHEVVHVSNTVDEAPVPSSQPSPTPEPMAVDEALSAPATPETPLYPQIPQKLNFTPRSRQTGEASSLFTKPVEAPVYVDEEARQQGDADASMASQESSFEAPPLKALPSKHMSPTKSCIRSPQKPKTPGRVVEFTSSTLSPLAQAQARIDRAAATATPDAAAAPAMQAVAEPAASEDNKENDTGAATAKTGKAEAALYPSLSLRTPTKTLIRQHSNAGSAAGSPVTTLSQTRWSRNHWLRLDELLQERRRTGALPFQLRHSAALARSAAGPSQLLGKRVSSQGESLRLEQWHLDVVDAFRAEVGGWDDAVLAKRLFSLMVGEERRRTGRMRVR